MHIEKLFRNVIGYLVTTTDWSPELFKSNREHNVRTTKDFWLYFHHHAASLEKFYCDKISQIVEGAGVARLLCRVIIQVLIISILTAGRAGILHGLDADGIDKYAVSAT